MAQGKSVHVVPGPNGGWRVLKSGSSRASKAFVTKEEAIDWGRTHSRSIGTELFIHRTDGTVQEKVANGVDPMQRHDGNAHAERAGTHGGGTR